MPRDRSPQVPKAPGEEKPPKKRNPFKNMCLRMDQPWGLSFPSKMPCASWGIRAKYCGVGSKLREVSGSVCSVCYAHKGWYCADNVIEAQDKRLREYLDLGPIDWGEKIVERLMRCHVYGMRYFRWFDSGDIVDADMFVAICGIAETLKDQYKFWLPTRELKLVKQNHEQLKGLDNLIVRVSHPMIDRRYIDRVTLDKVGLPPDAFWYHKSMVADERWDETPPADAKRCEAPANNGQCGECRACWDWEVKEVWYKKH